MRLHVAEAAAAVVKMSVLIAAARASAATQYKFVAARAIAVQFLVVLHVHYKISKVGRGLQRSWILNGVS
jgi:hypothetical protein